MTHQHTNVSNPPPLLSDQPELEPTRLWVGLRQFIESLSRLVPRTPAGTPILITGSWGAGKTTLMRALRARIDGDTGGRTIWFEAWRCESEGALLPALVRSVWQQAPQQSETAEAFERAWTFALVVALRGARLAAALAGRSEVIDAIGSAKDLSDDLETAKRKVHIPALDPTAELHEAFARLVSSAWPQSGQKTEQPITIFVDDLDRCDPQRAVAFIEQLRFIIDRSDVLPCRFIVAVDREMLVRAIASKFAVVGSYDGNRYLEKIFPLSFAIPAPEQNGAGELVQLLLNLQPKRDIETSGVRTEFLDDWHEVLGVALCDPNFSNPRLMKRCINRFLLIKHLEQDMPGGAMTGLSADGDLTLAKWLAAIERWPLLRGIVASRKDDWEHFVAAVIGKPVGALSTDISDLLRERGASWWIRREIVGDGGTRSLADFQTAELRVRRWGM